MVAELFARDKRRHSIWKSEAEYNSIFRLTLGHKLLDQFEEEMSAVEDFLQKTLGIRFPVMMI